MIRSTSYGSAVIKYTPNRSPRSSLSISVLPDGAVAVNAPEEADPAEIDERVRRRARWILRQQSRFAEFRTPPRQFIGGETHRYLGRQYRLKIDAAEKDRVLIRSGRLVVETRFPDDRDCLGTGRAPPGRTNRDDASPFGKMRNNCLREQHWRSHVGVHHGLIFVHVNPAIVPVWPMLRC